MPFFDRESPTVFVNNNGGISFQAGVSSFIPTRFPLSNQNTRMIAPFWADVDTRGTAAASSGDIATPNRVYYRITTNASDSAFARVIGDVRTSFPQEGAFTPRQLIVVTWYRVGAFSYGINPLNTFQLVLATDGRRSFCFYLYAELRWTYGSASNGVHAQAGFDAGDGTTFAVLPGSFTAGVVGLVNSSNIGQPGVWAFRVDSAITSAGCTAGSQGQLVPNRGSVFGGQLVTVYGPCLNASAPVLCRFGNASSAQDGNSGTDVTTIVAGRYLDNSSALCMAPYSRKAGPVPLYISNNGGLTWSAVAMYQYQHPETPGLPPLILTPFDSNSGSTDGGSLLWPVYDTGSLSTASSAGMDLVLSWPMTSAEVVLVNRETLVYQVDLLEIMDPLGTVAGWNRLGGPHNTSRLPRDVTASYTAHLATLLKRSYTSAEGVDTRVIGSFTTGRNEFGVWIPPSGRASDVIGSWGGRIALNLTALTGLGVRPCFLRLTARDSGRQRPNEVYVRTSNLRWLLLDNAANYNTSSTPATIAYDEDDDDVPTGSPSSSPSNSSSSLRWDPHSACAAWSASQPPATSWNAGLPLCPQTAPQVSRAVWSPSQDCAINASSTSLISLPGLSAQQWGCANCWARRGRPGIGEVPAAQCFTSNARNGLGAVAECCYDAAGRLLRSGNGAGSDARFAPLPVPASHWFGTALPRLICCGLSPVLSDCNAGLRPNGAFSWRGTLVATGDPHWLSLDGAGFTFNGAGDYVYLGLRAQQGGSVPSLTSLQQAAASSSSDATALPAGVSLLSTVRLLPLSSFVSTSSSAAGSVTAIRGWAGKAVNGSRVSVTLRGGALYVRVNGAAVDFAGAAEEGVLTGDSSAVSSSSSIDLSSVASKLRTPASGLGSQAAAAAAALAASAGASGLLHAARSRFSQAFGDVTVDISLSNRTVVVTWIEEGVAFTIRQVPVPGSPSLDGAFLAVSADVSPILFNSTFGLLGDFNGRADNDYSTWRLGNAGGGASRTRLRRQLQSSFSFSSPTTQRWVYGDVRSQWFLGTAGATGLFPDALPSSLSTFSPAYSDEAISSAILTPSLTSAAIAACGITGANATAASAGNISGLPLPQAACWMDAVYAQSPDLGAATGADLTAFLVAQSQGGAVAPEFGPGNPTDVTVVDGTALTPGTVTLTAAYPLTSSAVGLPPPPPSSSSSIVYSVVSSPDGACSIIGAASGTLTCQPLSLSSPGLAAVGGGAGSMTTMMGVVAVAATDPVSGAGALHQLQVFVVPATASPTPASTPSQSGSGSVTASRSITPSLTASGSGSLTPGATPSLTSSRTPSASLTATPSLTASPSSSLNITGIVALVGPTDDERNRSVVGGAVAAALIGAAAVLLGCFAVRRQRKQKEAEEQRIAKHKEEIAHQQGLSYVHQGTNPAFKHQLAPRTASGRKLPLTRGDSARIAQQGFNAARQVLERGGSVRDISNNSGQFADHFQYAVNAGPRPAQRSDFAPLRASGTGSSRYLRPMPSASPLNNIVVASPLQQVHYAASSRHILSPAATAVSSRHLSPTPAAMGSTRKLSPAPSSRQL